MGLLASIQNSHRSLRRAWKAFTVQGWGRGRMQESRACLPPHHCSTVLDLQAWGFTQQAGERRFWGARES